MELTNEIIKKIMETKTIEELMTLAKDNGRDLTREQAERVFAKFHQEGEIADEELDNVSAGCGTQESGCKHCSCVELTKEGNEWYCVKKRHLQ